MEKLNKTTDIDKYLESGVMTQPFLDDEYVKEMVMRDFEASQKRGSGHSKLASLVLWINHIVKYDENKKIQKQKFNRNAKEIWESGLATGCTDYAILFATFARQLGYPTTILHAAEFNWVQRFLNNEDYYIHYGHTFCECFFEGEWVLVDPTCKKIQKEYNPKKLELNYEVAGNSVFLPYYRGLDLGQRSSTSQHNKMMEEECLRLFSEECKR